VPTIYGSNVADSILTTACKMSSALGGTEVGVQSTFASTSLTYAEVRSKGGAATPVSAIPAGATGNGWIFWPGAGTYASGTWTIKHTHQGASRGIDTTIRAFKYNSTSGTYTAITNASVVTSNTTAVKTTYTGTTASIASVTCAADEGIYFESWWHDNNANVGSDNPTMFVSNSGTAGVANDLEITLPTFTPAATSIVGTSQELLFDATSGTNLGENSATSQESTSDASAQAGTNTGTSQELLFDAAGSATPSSANVVGTSQELLFDVTSGTTSGINTATNQETLADAPGLAGTNTATNQLTSFTADSGTTTGTDTGTSQETLFGAASGTTSGVNTGTSQQTLTDAPGLAGTNTATSQEVLFSVSSGVETGTNTGTSQEALTAISGTNSGVNTGLSQLFSFDATGNQLVAVILPPDDLSISIAGTPVDVRAAEIDDAINERSTARLVVRDSTGLVRLVKGQQISIDHNNLGKLFGGVVNDADEDLLYPNVEVHTTVNCADNQWYAGKRLYTGKEYTRQYAGDIVTDLLTVLAPEGITAKYASRRDDTLAEFAQGTLTNVIATDDGLQLARAGTTYTKTETTTSDFASGTLTDVQASSNSLQITPLTALRLRGTASSSITDCFTYRKIWGGSSITINNGDQLFYSVWIDSTSPESKSGVQIYCSDGTTFNNISTVADQYNIFATPQSDLSLFAQDQWMDRYIDLSPLAGKTIKSVAVALEGNQSGLYTTYFRNIQLYTSGMVLRQSFFAGTRQTDIQLNSVGYKNVTTAVVQVSSRNGSRITSSLNISTVGIVRGSKIDWTATTQTQAKSATNEEPQVKISASIDGGATWHECTNHQAIPCLIPGMNASTLMLKEDLNVGGPNPEYTPLLNEVVITVEPSFNTTKNDARDTDMTTTDWTGGTLSNLTAASNSLALSGKLRDWDDGVISSQSLYGTGSPAHFDSYGTLAVRCDNIAEVRSRLDFAGTWQNFVLEIDVQIPDNSGNYGVTFRTTSWNNTNDTYAYNAYISPTEVALAKGTNGGSGGFTSIASVAVTFATNTWYRLKITASGSTLKVAVDDVEYINTTDSSYSSAGYIAVRHFNNSGSRHSAFFDNFGIMATSMVGTRTNTALSNAALAPVGTVGNSVVWWESDEPGTAALLVEASTNGGSTWTACTNGGTIPGLTAGTTIGTKSLQLRQTFTTLNANVTPTLYGITALIMGAFSASGQRVSPVLNLGDVGRAGASLAAWTADVPTGTTLGMDVGPNTSSWSDVSSSNGATIPFIDSQPAPVIDTYDSNTGANYTATTRSGGIASTWTWNTSAKRLEAVGGRDALLVYNADTTFLDGELLVDLQQADQAGVFCRYQNSNNYYDIAIYDNASSLVSNIIQLYRISGGVRTLLTVGAIDFSRGIYKRIRAVLVGNTIDVYFDGTRVLTYSDTSPLLVAGKCGVRAGYSVTAGTSYINQFSIQNYGEDLTGQVVYTRQRLATTDPTVTPTVEDLTVSAHDPTIGNGVLIEQTDFSYKKYISEAIQDLADTSNYWQAIRPDKTLRFLPRTGMMSSWILDSSSGDLLVAGLSVKNASDTYRNRQHVTGGIDTVVIDEKKRGDDTATSWVLGYPLADVPVITLNDAKVTIGVKGTTGADFYYEIGSTVITQDTGATTLTSEEELHIVGTGTVSVNVMREDTVEQAAFAALEGGSGIVEHVIDVSGKNLTKAACEQLAQSELDTNKVRGRTLGFSTRKHGLKTGHLLTVFLPEHGIVDGLYLISRVVMTFRLVIEDGVRRMDTVYQIEASEGPALGGWTSLFTSKAA
jgi:hypothetical protein